MEKLKIPYEELTFFFNIFDTTFIPIHSTIFNNNKKYNN